MIAIIFTIDYEIYGTGEGSLIEHIYEPAKTLIETFKKHNATYTTFVEVAELEIIEAAGTDQATGLIKQQVQELYGGGFELGLHIHPQWYGGQFLNGRWVLNHAEYDLCRLAPERIAQIVDRSIGYFRTLLMDPAFTPAVFRAGNWLFQPSQPLASILAGRGIKVDSSVYKGGLQHLLGLDYRPALNNGYYWPFAEDVNVPDPQGRLVEIPVYADMQPIWKFFTAKRLGLEKNAVANRQDPTHQASRWRDFLRLCYPIKLDFCRQTFAELSRFVDGEIRKDRKEGGTLRPLVAIGHTKDLIDIGTIEEFLGYLQAREIPIMTFKSVLSQLAPQVSLEG